MRSLIVPEFACPDVGTLIRTISQDPAFQNSNHVGELLYVKIQKTDGLMQVVNERGIPELNECVFKYEDIRQQLRAGKHMVFLTVDSIRNSQVFVQGMVKIQEVVFIQEMEHLGHSRFFYYGEEAKGDIIKSVKSRPSCIVKAVIGKLGVRANIIFPFDTMREAKGFEEKFASVRKRLLFISGMVLPQITVVGEKGSPSRKIVHYDVLVNDWWSKEDSFVDVEKIVYAVNSIDDVSFFRNLATGESLYPEYVRKLMWYSTAYVRKGEPVFNLVLSGDPGVAKTTALAVHANIFSVTAKTMIGSGGTRKGLIPSFSGDVPREGALIKEPWFAPVDEFFSVSAAEGVAMGVEKIANMHRQYIRDLLPVVTRAPLRYPSAKDDEFECVMEASLMATDNLVPRTREALKSLVEEDPATLRRFCVVWLGVDVKGKVRESPAGGIEDNIEFIEQYWMKKYGFSVYEMKRFGEWFRVTAAKVRVDGVRCTSIQKNVVVELLQAIASKSGVILEDSVAEGFCRAVDFSIHVMAIVRCEAVMRVVYASKCAVILKELPVHMNVRLFEEGRYVRDGLPGVPIPIDEDYANARELFMCMMRDSMFLFDVSSWSTIGGGVKRV